MKFSQLEQQCVIDMLLERIYEYIDEHDITYREIDKPNETWIALCTFEKHTRFISYNAHIKKGFDKFRRLAKPFVIIHELGHLFDEEFIACTKTGTIKDDKFELTADNFIFDFCEEHLTPLEFYCIRKYIEAYSKIKKIYNKDEMKQIEEGYENFKQDLLIIMDGD